VQRRTASKQLSEITTPPARNRILEAAFSAFRENGYAQTSTLEIATRARVSKRELYALVGDKQQMLVACIAERAGSMRLSADVPTSKDRETLAQVLTRFGAQLLREVTDPAVIAVFRIAIAEADHTPEIARSLDSIGRGASRTALRQIMNQASSRGLVSGEPAEMSSQFASLLWGDLMMSLLLRVADTPDPSEIKRRARGAVTAFLRLFPPPGALNH
jgi:AcrR family transcriptional regulator